MLLWLCEGLDTGRAEEVVTGFLLPFSCTLSLYYITRQVYSWYILIPTMLVKPFISVMEAEREGEGREGVTGDRSFDAVNV